MNMKIGSDITGKVQEYKPEIVTVETSKISMNQVTRLDISGNYLNNNAYADHKKSMDEVVAQAKGTDVALSRKYMTVLSNIMSKEDYKKAMEDGFNPASVPSEEMVTILDHIKAAMLQSGQVVEGYNDDLSDGALKEITGREVNIDTIKQALKNANLPETEENVKGIEDAVNIMSDVDSLSDGSIKYMVENNLQATMENIYTARFSVGTEETRQAKGYYTDEIGGYFAKKAESIKWEDLEPQVEKVLEKMDISSEEKESKTKEAKWLIEQGIPVTEEKLKTLESITSIEFPVPVGRIISVSINAIVAGLNPKQGDLSVDKDIYSKAYEQQGKLISISESREEARLKLSIDANIKLLKQGISIDTKPMEEAIKLLKEQEESLKSQFLGAGSTEELDAKSELFFHTNEIVKELPTLPAVLIGKISSINAEFTISNAHRIGIDIRAKFSEASATYEAVGTEVRKDLGDSINKAFQNVDDILEDLGMEASDENRRAVRILGYNGIAINEEEIKKVKEADNKLNSVLKGLTPATTLKLIRDGVNPLDLKVDELITKIEALSDSVGEDIERYSKFLYKLEKNKEITEEEKQSYIGIYRLINRIEKTDHSALGRVLESNGEITFRNILTAARSSKKSFDIKISNDFGLLEDIVTKGVSITNQIMAAFEIKSSEEKNKNLEEEYISQKLNEIKDASKVSDDILKELTENRIAVSPENIMAAEEFVERPNELARRLKEFTKRLDNRQSAKNFDKNIDKAVNSLVDKMINKEETQISYENLIDNIRDTLSETVDMEENSLVDIKNISLMYKQLSLAADLSKEENYHIPVIISGEITDINLKLVHGNESGLVNAYMEVDSYGEVGVQIKATEVHLEALFMCEKREGIEFIKNASEIFAKKIELLGFSSHDIRVVTGKPLKASKLSANNADNNNKAVDTEKLYELAKCFIESMREEN